MTEVSKKAGKAKQKADNTDESGKPCPLVIQCSPDSVHPAVATGSPSPSTAEEDG